MDFSNNPKDFFKNIDKLHDVLVDIVYSYIPKYVTMFLTKTNYMKDHHLIRQYIEKRK